MRVGELIERLRGYENLEVEAVIQYTTVASIEHASIDVDEERMYLFLRNADRYYDQQDEDD